MQNNHYYQKDWLTFDSDDIDEIVSNVIIGNGKRLEIDDSIVKRILNHLIASKHVILIGAPGTGKTDLARRLLKELGKRIYGNDEPVEAVASYEWGRYEVVGGNSLVNGNSESDRFHLGCITKAIKERRLLLIDEFNRADMNKAFGEMFLALDHGRIELRHDEIPAWLSEEERSKHMIKMPSKFRMICTLNDYDKSLVNELSYGLLRRFAFVEIDNPNDKEKEKAVVMERVKKDLSDLDQSQVVKNLLKVQIHIDKFFDFLHETRKRRNIGLSTSIDVIRYLIAGMISMKKEPWTLLDESLGLGLYSSST